MTTLYAVAALQGCIQGRDGIGDREILLQEDQTEVNGAPPPPSAVAGWLAPPNGRDWRVPRSALREYL